MELPAEMISPVTVEGSTSGRIPATVSSTTGASVAVATMGASVAATGSSTGAADGVEQADKTKALTSTILTTNNNDFERIFHLLLLDSFILQSQG